MNKVISLFIFLGIGMLLCGCGLIPMSYTRTLPKPIISIKVVDSMTTEIIPNAEVICFYEKFRHKIKNFPPNVTNEFTYSHGSVLNTVKQADGTFIVEEKKVTAYSRFFIFEDYIVTISAKADKYIPFSIRYFPNAKPRGEHTWYNGSITKLTKDGQFIIFLDKVTTTPIRTIVVMDSLTKQPLLHAHVNYFYEWYHSPSGSFFRLSDNRFKDYVGEHVIPTVKHPDGTFFIEHDADSLIRQNVLVTISAKADNYIPFSLRSPAKALPLGERKWPHGARTLFTKEGIFMIYLEKGTQDQ
jgi:hypothetical protein